MVAMPKNQPTIWNDEPIQVQRGDVWQCGNHRVMCGDSTNPQDVARLFDGEQFSLCFTSPPYSDQRTYKLGSFDWHTLMCGAFDQIIQHGTPDCHILINLGLSHKNRQVDMYWLEWLMHCSQVGWPVFGWYVWDKGSGMPHGNNGRLASTHEFIFHFSQEGLANKWVETKGVQAWGKRGFRYQNGEIKGPNSPDKFGQPFKVPDSVIRINRAITSSTIIANHPAVFPVALPEFMMRTWSQPLEIVYEPFCGSGTSIIAGENLNRRVRAMEIEPSYCTLAIQRWQEHTGQRGQKIVPTNAQALFWPGAANPYHSVLGQKPNDFVTPIIQSVPGTIRDETLAPLMELIHKL